MDTENVNRTDTGRTRGAVTLTDALVKSSEAGGRANRIIYDRRVRGFGLRVTKRGHKSFILNYVVAGRERRLTIGSYPTWAVAAARDEAARLHRMVDTGTDPLAERQAARAAKTVEELWLRYRDEITSRKSPSTRRNEIAMWDRHILPSLGKRRLPGLTTSDFDRLHADVSVTAPIQANRVIAGVRHALNKAVRWGLIDRNPAAGVAQNKENGRQRYLNKDELARFVAAVASRGDRPSALALKFILLTGCRRGEALGATWDQFDLNEGTWTKPGSQTKQRRLHRVPLSKAARETLQRAAMDGARYVFPGRNGRPLVELKKMFQAVCKDANISNFRIHDLRHTYASYVASRGAEIGTLSKLLGHSQLSTTMRYAHFLDEALRAATNLMANEIDQGEPA